MVFAFNDILTEVYGYEKSRSVIWLGIACLALAGTSFYIVDILPPAPFWTGQDSYHRLLGFSPRIAFSTIVALFSGEFANSYVLSKMKYWHKGACGMKLGWRFVVSTMVGEAVNTIIFISLAFSGVMAWDNFFRTMLTLYGFKVLYEIIILPVHTRLANWVKNVEGMDHIDTPETTNYNPFGRAID